LTSFGIPVISGFAAGHRRALCREHLGLDFRPVRRAREALDNNRELRFLLLRIWLQVMPNLKHLDSDTILGGWRNQAAA